MANEQLTQNVILTELKDDIDGIQQFLDCTKQDFAQQTFDAIKDDLENLSLRLSFYPLVYLIVVYKF